MEMRDMEMRDMEMRDMEMRDRRNNPWTWRCGTDEIIPGRCGTEMREMRDGDAGQEMRDRPGDAGQTK